MNVVTPNLHYIDRDSIIFLLWSKVHVLEDFVNKMIIFKFKFYRCNEVLSYQEKNWHTSLCEERVNYLHKLYVFVNILLSSRGSENVCY